MPRRRQIVAGDPPFNFSEFSKSRRPSATPLQLVLDFGTSLAAHRQGYIIPGAARKGWWRTP
jgi:hypothetical protein